MGLHGFAQDTLIEQLLQQVAVICGAHLAGIAALFGLCLQLGQDGLRLFASLLFPKRAGGRSLGPGCKRLRNPAMPQRVAGQGIGAGFVVKQRGNQPVHPWQNGFVVLRVGPGAEAFRAGKDRPLSAQLTFKAAGKAQVVAPIRARGSQRMLEQGQKRLGRQLCVQQMGHMAQQPPRRRQGKRAPGAVIGGNAPAIKRGGDLPRQASVRGHKRHHPPGLGGLAEHQGNGHRLMARCRGFQQTQG